MILPYKEIAECAAKSKLEECPLGQKAGDAPKGSLERYNSSLAKNEKRESLVDNSENFSGLSDKEKQRVKDETGWSDEVVDSIRSWDEYEIYKQADLEEVEIGGKKCLISKDIDWDRKYDTGKIDENGNPIYETNRERIQKGRAPLDENGKPIELHHIGQRKDSPLAELTFEEHRGNGHDSVLHDKNKNTETHGEGNTWNQERQEYWLNRSEQIDGGQSDD